MDASGGGRWHRPGEYACLYTSLSLDGARAEYGKYLGHMGPAVKDKRRDLVCIDVSIAEDRLLDLTRRATRKKWGVRRAEIRGDSLAHKRICHEIADLARQRGYKAIKTPSAADDDAVNLNIYPPSDEALTLEPVPGERRNFNYGEDPLVEGVRLTDE